MLAEANQTKPLKNQREDQIIRKKKQDESSNNLLCHVFAEAKTEKRDLTDFHVEKKTLVESKRGMLGDRVTDAKLKQFEED